MSQQHITGTVSPTALRKVNEIGFSSLFFALAIVPALFRSIIFSFFPINPFAPFLAIIFYVTPFSKAQCRWLSDILFLCIKRGSQNDLLRVKRSPKKNKTIPKGTESPGIVRGKAKGRLKRSKISA